MEILKGKIRSWSLPQLLLITVLLLMHIIIIQLMQRKISMQSDMCIYTHTDTPIGQKKIKKKIGQQ